VKAVLDHLVVAARTLDEGVTWAQDTLGVTPAPGGAHALFGTHNRLLRLDGSDRAYLEIIAIDPAATPTRAAPLRRWFDLDDPGLQAHLAASGPQLVHWVARVDDIERARQSLAAHGIDRGPVLEATRPAPQGTLRWQITVRDDGQRLRGGGMPTLIQWGGTHPADALPASGLMLQSLSVSHENRPALAAIGVVGVNHPTTGPALRASLRTPQGLVELTSP